MTLGTNPGAGPPLFLASGSPRRKELLSRADFSFETVVPDVDENIMVGESASAMVRRLAIAKSAAVAASRQGGLVLACDTAVVLDAVVLGKPSTPMEAVATLLRLSGRDHVVATGFAIQRIEGGALTLCATDIVYTTVKMRDIARVEAADYVATGEPLDKAGSYAIQGLGARFVAGYSGSYTNIVGLPMEEVTAALAACGVAPSDRTVAAAAR